MAEGDLARLIVTLEASTKAYERALAKAQGTTVSTLRRIEKETQVSRDKVDATLGRKVDTANLTAQLNDIAVSLASGQSPFTVMLQQGAQISQVFGPGAGVKGVLAGLGSALIGLVNPTNLVLFAILGTAAAAVSMFGETKSEAEKVSGVLKAHSDLIGQIKDRYGDAIAGVKEYSAQSQLILSAMAKDNVENIKKQLTESAETLGNTVISALRKIRADATTGKYTDGLFGDTRSQSNKDLIAAATDFVATLKSGTPAVSEFRDRVAAIAETTSDQAIKSLAYELLNASKNAGEVDRALTAAQAAMGRIGQAALAAAPQVTGFGEALRALQGMSIVPKSDTEKAFEAYRKGLANILDAKDAKALKNEYVDAMQKIKLATDWQAASHTASETALEREIKSYKEKIALTKSDAATIGQSVAVRERERAVIELTAAAMETIKKERGANAQLTDQEKAKIQGLATEYGNARMAAGELEKAHERMVSALDAVRSTAGSTLGTFANDLANGVKMVDALKTAMDSLRTAIINALANQFVAALLGAPGTAGPTGGLFSTIFGGGRAAGGAMVPGREYRVGENGPERIVPMTRARVEPIAPVRASNGATVIRQGDISIVAPNSDAATLTALRREVVGLRTELTRQAGAAAAQKRGMRA